MNVTENLTGQKVLPSEIVEWDILGFLVERFKDVPNFDRDLRRKIKSQGFCGNLPVCPGAVEGFEMVSKRNVDIFIVTSPYIGNPTWHSERDKWLLRNFCVKPSNIVHTQTKQIVHGDLFVDDKPDNVQVWGDRGRNMSAFLWDTHHNQASKLPRLSSWEELDSLLESRRL